MELAIRFDEPTDEEKQIYFAMKRKVKALGNGEKRQESESNEESESSDDSDDDSEDEPIQIKRHGSPNPMTGLIGVFKTEWNTYRTQISIDGTPHYLGTFKTKEEAGVAYDRFVIDKSNEEISYVLNYPNMSDEERNEGSQKKRGKPNAMTGLIGVCKSGETYQVQIGIDGTNHYIGTFKTKEEAGVAYDRFVVEKSNEEVTYVLNYPNSTRQELQKQSFTSSKKRSREGNSSNINEDDYNGMNFNC
jgi:hypothetical protein